MEKWQGGGPWKGTYCALQLLDRSVEPGVVRLCSQATVKGQEEMASSCARRDLGWIKEKIS